MGVLVASEVKGGDGIREPKPQNIDKHSTGINLTYRTRVACDTPALLQQEVRVEACIQNNFSNEKMQHVFFKDSSSRWMP